MCNSCDAVTINGIYCHEHGCPESWKDSTKECRECGCDFKPEDQYQQACNSCIVANSDYETEDDCFFEHETEDGCDAGHYDCTDGL
jgi:hypothetical protein